MSLREQIENNLAIWLFGALGTGFLTGVGTYKSIMDIAQLDVISKSRLEKLESACKPEPGSVKPSTPAESSDVEKLQPQRKLGEEKAASQEPSGNLSQKLADSIKIEKSDPPEIEKSELLEVQKEEKSKPLEMKFSEVLVPFPERFDLIRPGMKLSEARTAFPNGEISSGAYSFYIEDAPFEYVLYLTGSREEDPTIESVHFFYLSEEAKQLVVRETLRKFGDISHKSESLGAVLSWPDINGFTLELTDNSYSIRSNKK